MNVTMNEAIAIYARASMKWFGLEAREKTRERIEQLTRSGDLEGARVYERVESCISQMEHRRASRE